MRYIHISKTCSDKVFKELYDESIVKPQQQDQKFHKMFVDGLKENNVKIDVISSRSINRDNMKKVFFKRLVEKEGELTYHYLPFINIKLLRPLSLLFGLIFRLIKLSFRKRKEVVVYCDILNTSLSFGVVLVTKILGIKRVAVVTDLPKYLDSGSSLFKNMTHALAKKYHGYIILSKYMNEIINPKNKPWMLLEGMTYRQNANMQTKTAEITFLYTGGLAKSSGIETLLAAFDQLKKENIKLMIAGQGECVETIKTYQERNYNISYLGTLINSEVTILQRQVHFLVSPRPSSDLQTKFAFPSKLIEYLSSGTPVLSTKLLGIPEDYLTYLNVIEDESVSGFIKALNHVLNASYQELQEKAHQGQLFAHDNKNNVAQTKRVITWTNQTFGSERL